MNGLTLRISSNKQTKPIKKDRQKEDIYLLLPVNFSDDSKVFEKLLSADSIEQQVQCLKETFNGISTNVTESEASLSIIDILVNIFLHLKPKSLLLPPLLKFMSTIPDHFHEYVQKCLTEKLKHQLQNEELSPKNVNDYSMTLLLCLESKHFPYLSLDHCFNDIIKFLIKNLQECHRDLINENTPVKKLEIINAIHSSVQVGITISQKYKIGHQIVDICTIAVNLLRDSDLPIDTRSASGLLAVYLAVEIEPTYWIKIFEEIINSRNELGTLSFCSGLLNVLSSKALEEVVTINSHSDNALNIIYKTIIDIEDRNASESGVVLVATRCMVLFIRSLTNLPHMLSPEMVDALLSYLWNHIEHYMDSVRHLSLSALNYMQLIAKSHPDLGIFEKITSDLENMHVEKRSKHAAISVLISYIPVSDIISQSPGLIKTLLSSALASPSSNYAINSLEHLMKQDFKEQTDKDKWFELWVSPLLECNLSAPLELLLTTVLKIHPSIVEHIVSLGLNVNNQNLAVILTCLKIGRKLNLLKGVDDGQKWKGLVDLSILEKCMYHAEDNIRLSCFALLIETSKTTEEFTTIELHLAKLFLAYNFTSQEPAVRQNSLAFCKKFLTRLRDSKAALIRRQLKCPRSDVTYENITVVLENYSQTIQQVKDMCIDSLFPGSSPFRRSFAFGLLAIYKELGFWTNYDEKTAQVLLLCLLDSYEENKAVAKELLKNLPRNLLKFNDKNHVQKYIEEALLLSSSIRPPDSISAAYYMSLLSSFENIMQEDDIVYNSAYYCASFTLKALLKELKIAKESLLQAACSGPLYGHLFVLRHLLQEIDLKEIGSCLKWKELLQRLIETAFDCNAVVSHVVYNSSPEGHLPMDFSYTHLKKDSDPQVTSQMVLLCSWRTVKEVSLLLGELSERASITGDDSASGLLTKEQVLAIGEHLTGLLSETKHRGAFEQAYLGFSKLASRLWRCSSVELHELPKKWLNETIECISKNENLSATRRSAGIPFIIQALICSELNNGSTKSLHNVMKSLLKIAKDGSSEGRVHALNILRALYRGSSLGEAVGPYVADGIAMAISGFNSHTWAERNSSTLLLSALMSRVFGVPRGKSETLSWRNRMTGRLFFQRYPNLYGQILLHLEESSKSPMYPALYPVLLLLGRLYPSSLEGTDSNLQLLKYLPFVMQCAESSILKTRMLAATAVSSLVASASYIDYINQLIIEITKTNKENHRHGLLLMILKLIQQTTSMEDLKTTKLQTNINLWLNNLLDIIVSPKYSYISKDTSVQAVLTIFLNYCDDISTEQKNIIEDILSRCLFVELTNSSLLEYGCDLFYMHSVILLLIINVKKRQTDQFVCNCVKLLETNNYYDVNSITLDLLNFILGNDSVCFRPNINENLKVTLNESDFSCELIDKIKHSKEIERIILNKLSTEDNHHEVLLKLLKTLQYFPAALQKSIGKRSSLQFLYNICKGSCYSVSSRAIKCLDSFLRFQSCEDIETSDFESVCEIIYDFSNAEVDDDCREVTAILLFTNFHRLLQRASSCISQLSLWTAAFRLIFDEISDIRRITSKALNDDVVPCKGVEYLLEKLVAETDIQLTVIILLFLAVGESNDFDQTEDESVFDRGSANTYYEDLILNRHSCNYLLELTKSKGIFSLSFDNEYSKWLYDRTGISCTSVLTFINNYKASIKCLNTSLSLLLPCRPVENCNLLQIYKLQNLLPLLDVKQ